MTKMLGLDEVFEIAERIEENGERFYEELAGRLRNGKVAQVFFDLAQAEHGHKAIFKRMREEAAKSDTMPQFPGDQSLYLQALADENVFAAKDINNYLGLNPEEAVEIALGAEEASIALFENLASLVSGDSRKSVHALAGVERQHREKLLTIRNVP